MRYKLDIYGYVSAVSFGCYLNNCAEYTGEVPAGYNTLEEWADNAYINAYYISNGNLTLDSEKLARLKSQEAIDKVENAPLIRKDIFESEETLKKQYKKATVTGKVITLSDINPLSPRVKITGVNPLNYPVLSVYTQGENILPYDAKTETIAGVSFEALGNGSVKTTGTAKEDLEYTIAGSPDNTEPIFVLKANQSYYYSDTAGFGVEFRYFDGETTYQQYVKDAPSSGVIAFDHDVKVTHVVRKMAKDEGYGGNVYQPRLNLGTTPLSEYVAHKRKVFDIDFSEVLKQFPYDPTFGDLVIENGVITLVINGVNYTIGGGYVGLFDGFNTVYATEDVALEVTYSTNVQDVESLEFLQGKATTTNKFKVLEDGSIVAHDGFFSGEIVVDTGDDETQAVVTVSGTKAKTIVRQYGIQIDNQKNNRRVYINPYQIYSGTVSTLEDDYGETIETFNTDSYFDFANGAIRAEGATTSYIKLLKSYLMEVTGYLTVGKQVTADYFHANETATVEGDLTVRKDIHTVDLYVDGNIACQDTVYTYGFHALGDIDVDGNVNCVKVIQSSKAELKKNFKKLQNAMDIINAIDIYKYNYKTEEDGTKEQIGLVIGDGFNYSEEVTGKENEGVDTYSLISVCVKAIQEQQEQINQLKEELSKLK